MKVWTERSHPSIRVVTNGGNDSPIEIRTLGLRLRFTVKQARRIALDLADAIEEVEQQ